ncbi:MAG: hypothetical protein A2157_15675 [Deltaproteobacteria bacterium RBG_16_47_11]|nr:MAG: hypothetical protein A2157_15675 [Deltaproteobacteria bacterium RBG_16_47_11]
MLVTCASCLTKYHLDDSKISEKGAKVRCSRCKHIFYLAQPPDTKEEVAEDFESFAKYHEELIGPDQRALGISLQEEEEEKEREKKEEGGLEGEEEKFLFSEKAPEKKEDRISPKEYLEEKEAEVQPAQIKKKVGVEGKIWRRGIRPSRSFALLLIITILVIGLFYLWAELRAGGKLSPYFEYPLKKINQLWNEIWGTEIEGLVVKNLAGYEEKVGEFSLYVIEGKVENQSPETKKHIKVKVVIFDQGRMKVTEKEIFCGRTLDRAGLRSLSSDFFGGEMIIQPQTEKEMVTPPGTTVPFMIIFKDLPAQAKEFKVDIVEAPGL